MSSSYSTNLRTELIGSGDQAGTWGNTTNTTLGTILEQAIAGVSGGPYIGGTYPTVNFPTDADITLTANNGSVDQARNAVLVVTSSVSLSTTRNVITPSSASKIYIVRNATTGGQSITIKYSTGVGVTIPNGATITVFGDGATGFYISQTNIANATNLIAGGTIASSVTATTQTLGDNTQSVATTAFVQSTIQTLYPVGSIYTSTVGTNPATLFGFGTWKAFGAGRVMVGQDGSSFVAGATGGSADAIVVSHTHAFSGATDAGNANISQNAGVYGNLGTTDGPFSTYAGYGRIAPSPATITDLGHAHTFSGTTNSAGTSGTNANLQPYIVVYMWNRTA